MLVSSAYFDRVSLSLFDVLSLSQTALKPTSSIVQRVPVLDTEGAKVVKFQVR